MRVTFIRCINKALYLPIRRLGIKELTNDTRSHSAMAYQNWCIASGKGGKFIERSMVKINRPDLGLLFH